MKKLLFVIALAVPLYADTSLRDERIGLYSATAIDFASTVYAHRRIPGGTDHNPLVSLGSKEEIIFMAGWAAGSAAIVDWAGTQMKANGSKRWRLIYHTAQVIHFGAGVHNVYVGVRYRTR